MWIKNKFLHLGYLIGREISGIINKNSNLNAEKRILLFCSSKTMEEHVLNFYEQIRDIEKYKCYLYFGEKYEKKSKHNIKDTLLAGQNISVINSGWKLYFRRWNLIVCPDLGYPFWIKKTTIPTLYIGHGAGGISYDGGEHTYDYSIYSLDEYGNPMFDIMLEPNKETARIMMNDPVYGKVIRSNGYRFAYKFKDAALRKNEYRKQLHISDNTKLISVWGSWNKDSLFHVLGEQIFDECRKLKEKGYEFVFSIHPLEYQKYSDDIEPMGMLVEQQRKKGFLVRSPHEDWMPFMIASDMVIVDYSAMLSLAVLAGKKVILSSFPNERIWKKSMHYELKQIFPILDNVSQIEETLKLVEETVDYEEHIKRFQEQLYVSQDEYRKFIRNIVEELIQK